MKKLISIFAAMALVGSMAAAPKKPAAPVAAKPAVAAPVVTAPTASSVAAAGKALGLSFGLSAGFVTDMFKQGDTLKKAAGAAGAGGVQKSIANASGASNCAGTFGAGTTSCSASGEGSSVSLNGIDIGLKVQYDILPWLFVRSGGNYILGLKNTYTVNTNFVQGGVTINDTATFTATGSIIEIPMLLGFNLVKNETGSLYFAAGVAYTIGQYDTTLAASRTQSAGTANTWESISNTTKQSGLGVMWLVGGKVNITSGISLFADVKFLSAAAAKEGAVTGTSSDSTKTFANSTTTVNSAQSALSTAVGSTSLPQTISGQTATTAAGQTGVGGLDLSYTRWQVGVQYEL